jgi:thiol-disulfide isomerase/thioredoxin
MNNGAHDDGSGAGGTLRMVSIAVVCGLIGFAAVYYGGGLGIATPVEPEAKPVRTSAPAQPGATAAKGDGANGKPIDMAKLPQGPGTNPLSQGEMAMFVWKAAHDVPEFAFKDAAGKDVTLADWKGRVVLVNLWATWCAPCRKEMPDLDRLQAELGGDEFEVVAISLDRGTDRKPKEFLEEVGVERLKLYHDPTARIGTKLQAIGLPATLLIDRDGKEIGRLVGPAKWDSDDALRLVRTAILKTRAP